MVGLTDEKVLIEFENNEDNTIEIILQRWRESVYCSIDKKRKVLFTVVVTRKLGRDSETKTQQETSMSISTSYGLCILLHQTF